MVLVTVFKSLQKELMRCQGQLLACWDSKREVLCYHSRGATAAPEIKGWGKAGLGDLCACSGGLWWRNSTGQALGEQLRRKPMNFVDS